MRTFMLKYSTVEIVDGKEMEIALGDPIEIVVDSDKIPVQGEVKPDATKEERERINDESNKSRMQWESIFHASFGYQIGVMFQAVKSSIEKRCLEK